ncbi:hypothetical protein AB0L83_34665 [Streptomyces sp. NPDC052071]
MAADAKSSLPIPLSPTYVLTVGTNSLSASFPDNLHSIDGLD